jgi:rhodanese-related sulfurtransferase
VTIIEKAPHVLPPLDADMAAPVAEELARNGVRVICGDGLKSLHAQGDSVRNVETERGQQIPADMVLLSIGVRPNVALAGDSGLKIGPTGAIAVDQFQRTSDPDVYAVGDASEAIHGVTAQPVRIPLAGPANRQGRLAGEHAATGSAPSAGRILGTAIVQVFGLTVGMTGLAVEAAAKAGFAADVAYVLPKHHAGYYPDARSLRIKLVYDNTTGRLLGAQIVGEAGVDKRIDVIATAVHFAGSVDDLAVLDLAYAPQFGSAKDPVHLAAMVAQNQRRQIMPAITFPQIRDEALVDVRTPVEFAAGTLAGAANVPVDELRQRLSELDPNRATVIFCQVGQRGYIAQRILHQRGFTNVRNLKGGYSVAVHAAPTLSPTGKRPG